MRAILRRLFELRDRATGGVKGTGTRVDLVFGSNAPLRAVAEVSARSAPPPRFVHDCVAAWSKVMNPDRPDLAWTAPEPRPAPRRVRADARANDFGKICAVLCMAFSARRRMLTPPPDTRSRRPGKCAPTAAHPTPDAMTATAAIQENRPMSAAPRPGASGSGGRPSVALLGTLTGTAAMLVGAAVLVGWALDSAALKSVLPGWVSMKPNTAVAFLLTGIAVLLPRPPRPPLHRPPSPASLRLSRACALLAGLIGLLSLAEYAFAWNPGFDQWLFTEPPGAVGTSHPGRMAPDTAICFVLLAVGGEFSRRTGKSSLALGVTVTLGALVATIGLVETLSYFTPGLRTYGWGGLTMMALPTALLFTALGVTLLGRAQHRPSAGPGGSAQPFEPADDSTWLKFLLVFAGLAAGIVAAGTFYYRNLERNFHADAAQELSAIAELKVGELTQFRRGRLAEAALLHHNPAFTQLVRRLLAPSADPDARRQLQAWLAQYPIHSDFDRVRLLDVQGGTLLAIPAGLSPVTAELTRDAAETLRAGHVVFQDFHRDPSDQRICLAVLVPLFDEDDGRRPLGVLVLRIDPATYLYPFINRWPVPSATAETLLVRREGNEAVFLNELRFQANTALRLRASLTTTTMPAVSAALGRSGVVDGLDYRGVAVLAATRAVPDSPWFLVARRDLAEIYAPLRAQLWQIITLVVGLLFGAGAGVGFVWRQQRVRFYQASVAATAKQIASDLRYRRLFESARDGMLILDGATGRVVDANPVLTTLVGSAPEDILGQLVWDLPAFRDLVPTPASFAKLQQQASVRAEGVAIVAGTGRRIAVEFTSNLYSVDHQTVIQCDIRDITERIQAEKMLRRLSAVIEQAPLSVIIADRAGTIEYVNPRFSLVTGYSAAEVLGKNPRLLKSGATPPETYRAMWQALRHGQVWTGELLNRTKSGEPYLESAVIAPVVDDRGHVTHYVALKDDITAKQRHEAELNARLRREREISEMKTRFISVTSHEFRTPMAAALGSVEILANHLDRLPPKKRQELLARITDSLHRMTAMLDEILLLSRLDANRVQVRLAPLELPPFVQHAIEEVRLGDRDLHRFEFHATGDPTAFPTDANLLQHILSNLLSNAVRYSPAGSLVTVRLAVGPAQAQVTVEDQGIGIPEADLARIFEPFERGSNIGTIQGTGLGLNIVQRMVAVLGGTVEAAALAAGGTRFSVIFPRHPLPPPSP